MILNPITTHPQTRSFVLKLHRDAAPSEGRLVGRLDHVVSGQQFYFTSAEELIARIAECDCAATRREGGA